jgi:hypothetical protein
MAKINKVYPAFFNGVSQQTPEFVLDSQCKDMVNCVPDIVTGLTKRPPVKHTKTFNTAEGHADFANYSVFHTYDRGEDAEEYFFVDTQDTSNPVRAFNRAGNEMTITYDPTDEAEIKTYLNLGNLRGLTVQDRTWMFSKNAVVGLDASATSPLAAEYKKTAYYWLKRGSGDRYNPFNYAVYLNSRTFEVAPPKPSSDDPDPEAGAEDSTKAAEILANRINTGLTDVSTKRYDVASDGSTTPYNASEYIGEDKTGVTVTTNNRDATISSVVYTSGTGILTFTVTVADNGVASDTTEVSVVIAEIIASDFTATVRGSLLEIVHNTPNTDFTFSSWDSWGNQASEGWKGSVNKLTDLPKDMPFDNVYVEIIGTGDNTATNYFVKWNGSAWEECLDPTADRGQLSNMPVKLDRSFITEGTDIATFTFNLVDWSLPRVGNEDNNPDPSFVGKTVQDLFFYKNRLGLASEDGVSLTETANYTNWYVSTATDILDTDVIDITLSSTQASKIYYAKPFNNSLYMFTKYAQYELTHEGSFGPATVSLNNTTNYPMAVEVEPVVVNNSLYFISNTDNRQQLREYVKTQNLNVKGIDLNIGTPTYLEKPIKYLVANGVLGYVLCCTDDSTVYLYNYKEDGEERIQSAWNKWETLSGVTVTANKYEYHNIESKVLVFVQTPEGFRYHQLQLDYNIANSNVDTSSDGTTETEYPYEAKIVLPDYYPKVTEIKTPLNKVLIKKITIEGSGSFDAEVYRKDYNTTYAKSHLRALRDLDLHIASKVGNVTITLKDSTADDFVISSVVLEGLFNTTSREMR